jgi:hypothetical protein
MLALIVDYLLFGKVLIFYINYILDYFAYNFCYLLRNIFNLIVPIPVLALLFCALFGVTNRALNIVTIIICPTVLIIAARTVINECYIISQHVQTGK